MTRDFIDQLTESFDKEGYEYLLLSWKDLETGVHINTKINNLNQRLAFTKSRSTKRESIIKLVHVALEVA